MTAKNLATEVEKLRSDRLALVDELDALENAELPPDEWRARAYIWLDRIIDDAEKKFAYELRGARSTYHHQPRVDVFNASVRGAASPMIADVDLSIIPALLLPDVLKTKIDAAIDAEKYEYGLPAADRPKRRAQVERQIDAIERREERLIRTAESNGLDLLRRADAKPEIVLAWDDVLEG